MDDLTIPFLGARAVARTQYPFGVAAALRRHARDGQRLGGDDGGPAAADRGRGHPGRPRARRDTPPFLPAERLTLVEALTGSPPGSAFVNHDDEGGASPPAAGRTSRSSTPTSSPPTRRPAADARAEYTIAAGAVVAGS